MMLSSPIHDRSDTRQYCRLSTASADARVESLDWPALAAPIWPRNLRSARLPLHPHPCFEAKTAPPPLRSNLLTPYTAAKSP
jgi:hypothetical protein